MPLSSLKFALLAGSFTIVFGTSLLSAVYWVSFPPEEVDTTGIEWSVVLLPILPFKILWYYVRTEGGTQRGNRRTRVAGSLVIGGTLALFAGAVLSPPDVFSSAAYTGAVYPAGIVAGYFLTK